MASGFEFAQAFGFLLSKAEVGDSGTDHHLLYSGSPKPFAGAGTRKPPLKETHLPVGYFLKINNCQTFHRNLSVSGVSYGVDSGDQPIPYVFQTNFDRGAKNGADHDGTWLGS